ncbi:hypothetical protein VTN31DRAFT_2498 [Thermomyces dupontii]|uniref:uncharacterized protein n=1 Tax=Talaromyces thermophilus TaxID=28565 RepID=UPI0037447282
MSIERKLLIFLYLTTNGASYRNAVEKFQHSLTTMSSVFHHVLDGILAMYPDLVRIPSTGYSKEALGDDPSAWPYFDGCLGALGCTHLPLSIPVRDRKPALQNRDGVYSQKVLAARDFDLNFVYVFCRDGRLC